jgi:hypothetical protein
MVHFSYRTLCLILPTSVFDWPNKMYLYTVYVSPNINQIAEFFGVRSRLYYMYKIMQK